MLKQKFSKLSLNVVGLMIFPALAALGASPCDHLPYTPKQLVAKAVFPAHLTPFGDVCFAAHTIPDPDPDYTNPIMTAPEPYFAFSLVQNGKIIYQFPYPEPDLWGSSIDAIIAVAFRKLNNDKYTDVVVIGHDEAANGNDLYIPVIYRATGVGFAVDTDLSEALMEQIIPDMPDLLNAIDRNPSLKP